MDEYKLIEGKTYFVKNDYSNYSGNQKSALEKSKCPRGAKFGDIGSCCGFGCTRSCAIES